MGTLGAAAGEVDLVPPAGGWMSGFAARIEPSRETHDAVIARALLLADERVTLAIVSCDLIGLTASAVARIRVRVEVATGGGIPGSHILIACTHTHSGPASMPFRGVMGHVDEAWLHSAIRKIADMVAGLFERLRPARIASATTVVTGVGYNRQDASRPIDDRLRVMAVEAFDGTAIATLVNYATHPVVLGPGNLLYSADYPGEVARRIAGTRGGIALFLQGASGDADPLVYRDRGWGKGTFDDARRIGDRLAEAAIEVLEALGRAAWREEPGIRIVRETLGVPVDPLPTEAEVRAMIAGFEADRQKARGAAGNRIDELIAEAMLDWAAEAKDAALHPPAARTLPAELFVAAIAGTIFVGVPFETYAGIALEIARLVQPENLFFAGYANGLFGYCPTRQAKDQGGYGPDGSSRWFPELVAPVGYGADELIIDRATALARELREERPSE